MLEMMFPSTFQAVASSMVKIFVSYFKSYFFDLLNFIYLPCIDYNDRMKENAER